MKNYVSLIILNFLFVTSYAQVQQDSKIVLVIHGGAGSISKKSMTDEKYAQYEAALKMALQRGYDVIKSGKRSLDAVQVAVNILEDSPLFNAGKGAVFTNDGKIELDASIMDGRTLKAGAVAGVTTIKNPINAARAVMEKSEHVMMIGKGAEQFAVAQGCDSVSPSYFFTEQRWQQLKRVKEQNSSQKNSSLDDAKYKEMDEKFGTVGAVALDSNGDLAAATSTGGMMNKKYGRVGDSPIIGAGTYCNNATAGISCTGWGEYYIRLAVANRVSNLIEFKNISLKEATTQVIQDLGDLGGTGGIIALDKNGKVALEFNTSGMYRGTIDENGVISISIFKD